MHDLHILPPNCQIQLFPHTATFKLSPVELFVHSPGKPAHFKTSPAHASIHSFIHSLRQRRVCFVQWRQTETDTVAHEGHLSHTHAARTPTEDSNLVTFFFVIKCTNREGCSTCYGCFSQPLYLHVCVMCMHMYMFRCARARTCVVSVHVCTYTWRPEVDIRCLIQLLSTLFFEAGFLNLSQELTDLTHLASQVPLVSSISAFYALELQAVCSAGIYRDFRSSCLLTSVSA